MPQFHLHPGVESQLILSRAMVNPFLGRSTIPDEEAERVRQTYFFKRLQDTPLASYRPLFYETSARALHPTQHGDLSRWLEALRKLPDIPRGTVRLDSAAVSVEAPGDRSEITRREVRSQLMELHPWRKGPYFIHGVTIDSEWRS